MYPFIVLPPLPEKRVMFSWQKVATDTFDPDFVDRRRAGLEVGSKNYYLYRNILMGMIIQSKFPLSVFTLFYRTSYCE